MNAIEWSCVVPVPLKHPRHSLCAASALHGLQCFGERVVRRQAARWESFERPTALATYTRIKNIEARVVCRAFCRQRGDIPDSSSMPINYDAGVCSFAGLGGVTVLTGSTSGICAVCGESRGHAVRCAVLIARMLRTSSSARPTRRFSRSAPLRRERQQLCEFHASEMTEWEFPSQVVELADRGILLDVKTSMSRRRSTIRSLRPRLMREISLRAQPARRETRNFSWSSRRELWTRRRMP